MLDAPPPTPKESQTIPCPKCGGYAERIDLVTAEGRLDEQLHELRAGVRRSGD
jgi:hypothetical protein